MPTTIQARTDLTKFEKHNLLQTVCVTKLTKEEMELLLKDANPMMLRRLADDPELKKQQIQSFKELFALACQSIKEGLADDQNTPKALEIIDAVIWARTYDQEINKGKNTTPFSFITEDQVKSFYGEGSSLTAEQKQHAKDLDEFFKVQLNFASKNKSIEENTEPTDEAKAQVRQEFAKIKIYENEAKAKVKSGALPEKFVKNVELQSKLQKLQFLSRMYSKEVLAKKAEVTDEDVQKYIAEHSELNLSNEKKAKAMEVLQRLKNGEDFVALAKQYSDDPSSKEKGGLYKDVTEGGGFEKTFEAAALALQPGQFTQELVATPFGFHIIKLEKKGTTKDLSGQVKQTYDVRHILFSTMVKDPDNPAAREMPVKDFVRSKLETEKEKKVIDEILANNPVEIAEDFEIPKVSDEQLQQLMQQQMQQKQVETEVKIDNEITLPTKIKTYLNLTYRGWKLASTSDFCSTEFRRAIVSGDFDGDGKIDYTVKIVKGSKGYVLAFLERNNRYENHILRSIAAADIINTQLSIFRKGEKYITGDVRDENPSSITLKNDAPFDGTCAPDTGGIHIYKNGRFVAY